MQEDTVGIYCTKIPILLRVILVGGEILFPNSGQISLFLLQKYFVHSQHFNITVSSHLNIEVHVYCEELLRAHFFPKFVRKVNSCTMNGNFVVARCPFLPHIAA